MRVGGDDDAREAMVALLECWHGYKGLILLDVSFNGDDWYLTALDVGINEQVYETRDAAVIALRDKLVEVEP